MSVRGYEEMFECPYNKAHQILKHRFQTHLVKCRKSYPNVKKVACPFNAVHMVNAPELSYHASECPDRASFDRYKYGIQSGTMKIDQPPVQHTFNPVESEECWDDENVPTYDPQKYVESAPVLRTLNLEPPATRAAFREAERRRLNHLMKTE